MFTKSNPSSNPDLFNSFVQNLEGARLNQYIDKESWHNVFRDNITWQIDEKDFEVLFSGSMGRPNSPIRVLVAMMILKEGHGWSDKQLFEECQFNILVMSSLGLSNINDSIPSQATYYNLKKSLYEYQIETGKDIIGGLFQKLTRTQADIFGVTGDYTRMDSVLIGSNIAKSSRLQLIINVLQEFYKDIKKKGLVDRLESTDQKLLEKMSNQKRGPITYQLDSTGRDELIKQLGYVLFRIQKEFSENDSEKYHLITRVLIEQYRIEGEKVELKGIKELSAKSLQSPYDEDAEYRNKNGEKIQGIVANVTETSNDVGLNLITDALVEGATTPDNEFVEPGIENSLQVIASINHLNTDGAFHSKDNQEYITKNDIEWILSGIQGREGHFDFKIEEGKVKEITNTQTKEVFVPITIKSGKYRITIQDKFRYFSQQEIDSYLQRQKVNLTDHKKKNRRNNVEATIFQLVWTLRNKKTRYRGIFKNQLWAYLRCLWINLIRIKNFIGELCPKNKKWQNETLLSTVFAFLSTISTPLLREKVKIHEFLGNIIHFMIFGFVRLEIVEFKKPTC